MTFAPHARTTHLTPPTLTKNTMLPAAPARWPPGNPPPPAAPRFPPPPFRHYNQFVVAPPKLIVGEGLLKANVLPHCPTLHRPYRPTPWAANTHMQTILGREMMAPCPRKLACCMPRLCTCGHVGHACFYI